MASLGFGVLGPLEVVHAGQPIVINASKHRVLLAALLIGANRTLSIDQLAERLWGERPPSSARKAIQLYVLRLRRLLTEDVIETRPDGYLIRVGPDQLDLSRFTGLTDAARQAARTGDADAELRHLTEALACWRGPALCDVPSESLQREVVVQLAESRLRATERRMQVALDLGQHREIITDLVQLTKDHPWQESFWKQLIIALHRADRLAEALDTYRTVHRKFRDELGIDPGKQLQQLHRTLLSGEAGATPAPPADPGRNAFAPPTLPVPRQLPAPPTWFAGRTDQFAALDKGLLGDGGGAVVVAAVVGAGGIGKTALALRWAQHNAHRFPDGQLFVNLRGFDPMGEPVSPSAALRLLLEGMGVAAGAVPSNLDALVGLWRSVLAGKRVLLVLDNVRGSGQVEPLLPGSPTCAVLVTSRHQLPGLITTHGALPVRLDPLGEAEAAELLKDRLGEDRVAAEPEATAELVRRCAGLPLALNIVAARATVSPTIPLAALAAELVPASSRLDALDAGEITADLRTVFAASYEALSSEAATLFELLGLAPGPDIGLPAAAALLGEEAVQARKALRELENAHLVSCQQDRYRMHDLVQSYAAELTRARDTGQAALIRLVEHYAYAAHLADRFHPHSAPVDLAPPSHGPHVLPFEGAAAALAWLDEEQHCLLAAQQVAADRGWDRLAWHLAWALDRLFYTRGMLAEHLTCWRTGLAAAERLGEDLLLALAHRGTGVALSRAGLLTEGLEHLLRALCLAEQAGDTLAQARVHRSLAWTRARLGDPEHAADHARHAVRLYECMDDPDPALLASGLNAEGWYTAKLGHYEQARQRCEAALALAREHHHRELEPGTLDSLGYIAHHTGDPARALDYFQQAIKTYQRLGTTYGEASTLTRIGDAHLAAGDPVQACQAWTNALDLYVAQHRTEEAEVVRQKINDHKDSPSRP